MTAYVWTTGERVTAAKLNLVSAEIDYNGNPSACYLLQQTAQTGWSSGTNTAITFGSGSEVLDTDALHDTSTNNTRIVIGKRLGWWQVCGVYCAPNNGNTTLLRCVVGKNGSALNGGMTSIPFSGSSAFITMPSPVVMVEATSATDYVELYGYQTAGAGTLGTAVAGGIASGFNAVWVRPS